jgi:hypothetical protein
MRHLFVPCGALALRNCGRGRARKPFAISAEATKQREILRFALNDSVLYLFASC